jgi:hypothetical protein
MTKKNQKKEAACYQLNTNKVAELLENNELAGLHIGNLITTDVCCWYNDTHKKNAKRFRAVFVKNIHLFQSADSKAMLYINFDICVHNKKGKVESLPHFGAWQLWKDGGFLEARMEYLPDGNTEFIMEGELDIKEML